MEKHKNVRPVCEEWFEEWLEKEGLTKAVEVAITKKAFIVKLQKEMKRKNIDKSNLAKIMNISRSSIGRLFDPCEGSNLATLTAATLAMGKKLRLSMVRRTEA